MKERFEVHHFLCFTLLLKLISAIHLLCAKQYRMIHSSQDPLNQKMIGA